jgi:hypothetical protein
MAASVAATPATPQNVALTQNRSMLLHTRVKPMANAMHCEPTSAVNVLLFSL